MCTLRAGFLCKQAKKSSLLSLVFFAFLAVQAGVVLTTHAAAAGVNTASVVPDPVTGSADLSAGRYKGLDVHVSFDTKAGKLSSGIYDFDADTIRHLKITLPKSVFINSQLSNYSQCEIGDFVHTWSYLDPDTPPRECSSTSRIGTLKTRKEFDIGAVEKIDDPASQSPIFNLRPFPGDLALLGIDTRLVDVPDYLSLNGSYNRNKNYIRVYVDSKNDQRVVLDIQNFPRARFINPPDPDGTGVNFTQSSEFRITEMNMVLNEIFTLPTSCGEFDSAVLETTDFNDHVESKQALPFPASTDCNGVEFDPTAAVKRDSDAMEEPTAIEATTNVPGQSPSSPFLRSQSAVASTSFFFPEDVGLSIASGDGLESCKATDFDFYSQAESAKCPPNSRIGTATIGLGGVPKQLKGNLYLGEVAKHNDNPQYPNDVEARVYMEVTHPDTPTTPEWPFKPYGPFWHTTSPAFRYKAIGALRVAKSDSPEAKSGQISIHFGSQNKDAIDARNDLPDLLSLKWAQMTLRLEAPKPASPESWPLVVNSSRCSQRSDGYATFTPWKDKSKTVRSKPFSVKTTGLGGSPGCVKPRPFLPQLSAQVVGSNKAAANPAGVKLNVTARPNDDWLDEFRVRFPTGMQADFAKLGACKWDDFDNDSCPSTSRFATATSTIGSPKFYGRAVLPITSIYYMQPDASGNNVAMRTAVKVGPFDLGATVARGSFVDIGGRLQLQLHSLPKRLNGTPTGVPAPMQSGGIPIPLQELAINLDQIPDFLKNPSDCYVDRSFELQATSFYDASTSPWRKTAWTPIDGPGCK